MNTETVTVELDSGGSLQLVVSVDFLAVGEADFRFVRGLVDSMRAYTTPVALPAEPEPAAAVPAPPVEPAGFVVYKPERARKHRDRSNRNTGRRPGPAGNTPDYPTIAAFINDLLDREPRASITPAVVAHFGVPTTTAKNWMTRCRKLQLIGYKGMRGPAPKTRFTPAPVPVPDVAMSSEEPEEPDVLDDEPDTVDTVDDDNELDEQPTSVDLGNLPDPQQIKADYLDAIRAGKRAIETLANDYLCDRAAVMVALNALRAAGELPPVNEPQLPQDERRAILEEYRPEPAA